MRSNVFNGWGLAALGLLVLACRGESSPAVSSSSHWVVCRSDDACASVRSAVGCRDGYCVDADGERIAVASAIASSKGSGDDAGPRPRTRVRAISRRPTRRAAPP